MMKQKFGVSIQNYTLDWNFYKGYIVLVSTYLHTAFFYYFFSFILEDSLSSQQHHKYYFRTW